MKKLSKILAFVLSMSLCLSFTAPALAAESSDSSDPPTDAYNYPLIPGTPEWDSITDHAVKVDMLQIPNDAIATMDTASLVESVMNYPYLSDMLFFDTSELGYNIVKEHFNGLQELATRPDATTELLNVYRSRDTSFTGLKPRLLQIIIQQNDYLPKMTESELKSYNAFFLATSRATASTTTTVRTPKGSEVEVYILGEELSAADKANLKQSVLDQYKGATILSEATTNYNCHSYAWYSASTSNKYWMNDPSAYMDDGSYSLLTTPKAGSKIYYIGAHSGIINSVVIGPPPTDKPQESMWIYTSKWGQGPLVKSDVTNCPYWYPVTAYSCYTR